jgi:hypothetical protein
MPLELLIVAPEGRSMERGEMERRLGERMWARLSATEGAEINMLSIEIATPIDATAADEVLAFAEDVAARLGWRVMEPVTGAQIDASERMRWIVELCAWVDEAEEEGESWIVAAFDLPVWSMILMALVAFASAAAVVLATNVSPNRFGPAMGILGTVLLIVFFLVAGAWRRGWRRRRGV